MITSVCIIAFLFVSHDFIASLEGYLTASTAFYQELNFVGAVLDFVLLLYIFFVFFRSNF